MGNGSVSFSSFDKTLFLALAGRSSRMQQQAPVDAATESLWRTQRKHPRLRLLVQRSCQGKLPVLNYSVCKLYLPADVGDCSSLFWFVVLYGAADALTWIRMLAATLLQKKTSEDTRDARVHRRCLSRLRVAASRKPYHIVNQPSLEVFSIGNLSPYQLSIGACHQLRIAQAAQCNQGTLDFPPSSPFSRNASGKPGYSCSFLARARAPSSGGAVYY